MAKSWTEVESDPQYRALPPDQKEAARNQYFSQVVAPRVPKAQLQAARAQFDADTAHTSAPEGYWDRVRQSGEAFDKAAGTGLRGIGNTAGAALDVGANLASGIAGDIAGAATSVATQNPKRGEAVREALTYEPRTPEGKAAEAYLGAVTAPVSAVVGAIPAALKRAGHPIVAQAARAGIDAASLLGATVPGATLRRALGGASRTAEAAETGPEALARDYVARNTALDWDALPRTFKATLTKIARNAKSLGRLDPQAVERQGRLASLREPVPATRGQLTRDPVQLRNEGNLSATDAGKPIRNVYLEQNRALLKNLDILKGKVRGVGRTQSQAETPEQLGESVQDRALRAKLKAKKAEVKALYSEAENAGETAEHVSLQPIKDMIARTPDKTHYAYVEHWFQEMGKDETTMSIRNLEDLRKTAVRKAMAGGEEGYYAGKLIESIDQATAGKGGDLYKAARAANRDMEREFHEQGGVARLVEDKSRTDRETALEDTWKRTVLGGSIEDLRNVKRSLLTGGTSDTRAAGREAWRDIRAQTIQHIKDEASKGVAHFEDGTPNITAGSMQRAIKAIGPAKLDEIFGPGTAREIHRIMEATRAVKTEPPAGFKGSPTAANILAFLEKSLGFLPGAGDLVSGSVRKLNELRKVGQAGRQVRAAVSDPLAQRGARGANTLASLGARSVSGARAALPILTLRNDAPQPQQ